MISSTYEETKYRLFEISKNSSVPVSTQFLKFLVKIFSKTEAMILLILNLFSIYLDKISHFCKVYYILWDLLGDYTSYNRYDTNSQEESGELDNNDSRDN